MTEQPKYDYPHDWRYHVAGTGLDPQEIEFQIQVYGFTVEPPPADWHPPVYKPDPVWKLELIAMIAFLALAMLAAHQVMNFCKSQETSPDASAGDAPNRGK